MSRRHALIPGGCHTYSKGDNRFPDTAPAQIVRAKGGLCWDADGCSWVDWGMGINNVLIGHAEDAIDEVAIAVIRSGQAFTRPSVLEEEAADVVLSQFPHSEMIKFCKNGSDANNAAVRLARAVTGRQHIAFDGTAPFFSTADWFCGDKPNYRGTLDAERGFAHTFRFNDVESLERVFAHRPLACLILELCRTEAPTPAFLAAIEALCRQHGTLLVVDEVVTAFRYHLHGAAARFGLVPDLFTIGKGVANGYAVAALAGRREYMRHGASDVFLLSTTNGAESSGLAAAIATVRFYRDHDVIGQLDRVGGALCDIVREEAARVSLPITVRTDFSCRPAFEMPDEIKAAFYRAVCEYGVLLPPAWACPCYRRSHKELEQTRAAVRYACAQVAEIPRVA